MSLNVRAASFLKLSKTILSMSTMHSTSKSNLHTSYWRMNLKLSKTQTPSTSELEDNSNKTGPRDGFITIYRLPSVVLIANINRARRLHTAICGLGVPVSMALMHAGIISGSTSVIVGLTGLAFAIKLYFLGYAATNVVGFIYVSPDLSTVQIAYLDHQGNRKDDIFQSSDLVPLSEVPSHRFEEFYFLLHRYSQPTIPRRYKLSLKYGNILDINRFTEIFGEVHKQLKN